jgi:23S rRNA (cytidine1920-2'-O)/16S rRNA (cytidine1409-2'-O)-methyltransferase
MGPYVSRGGQKLEHALRTFGLEVKGKVCADLGCSTGGFVDCLLQHGAELVYAVDTGYGVLDWKLRNDPRVVTMERTNALHVSLPRKAQLVTVDVAWTRQRHVLPAAAALLAPGGVVVTLIKPHYEAAPALLRRGVLPAEQLDQVVRQVMADIAAAGLHLVAQTPSPIKGSKGNREILALVRNIA